MGFSPNPQNVMSLYGPALAYAMLLALSGEMSTGGLYHGMQILLPLSVQTSACSQFPFSGRHADNTFETHCSKEIARMKIVLDFPTIGTYFRNKSITVHFYITNIQLDCEVQLQAQV